MPRLYITAVMAAVLSACGSEPAELALGAAGDEPTMHEYGTHEEAMAEEYGSAAADAAAATLEADARRRLEEITENPHSGDLTLGWYALHPRHIPCEPMLMVTGDETPDQFVRRATSMGGRPIATEVEPGLVHISEQTQGLSAEMILVQDERRCRELLSDMQEIERRGMYVPMQ